MKVYAVVNHAGEYSDQFWALLEVFDSKEKADSFCKGLTTSPPVPSNVEELYSEYLSSLQSEEVKFRQQAKKEIEEILRIRDGMLKAGRPGAEKYGRKAIQNLELDPDKPLWHFRPQPREFWIRMNFQAKILNPDDLSVQEFELK